ncbi:MAG: GatB/YqeY domain-containing protein [Pseudomonadota bacterium]
MSLKEKINDDVKTAMRAKEEARLGTLRMLTAAIKQREVDGRVQLDDAQVVAVIEKLLKQGRESIEQFEKGGRKDLADKERSEMAVWQVYMPQQLSDDEIDKFIVEAIATTSASSIKDMGKVMGILKAQLQGRADMGQVGSKIKAKLGG